MKKTGEYYLIDTNIVIDFFGNDDGLKLKLATEKVILTSVVLGELYFGACASSRKEIRLREIEDFISNYDVLSVNEETAHIYGQVKAHLKEAGTPIPENDVWIAALSLQHSLVVATRDHHFDKVRSLQVAYW